MITNVAYFSLLFSAFVWSRALFSIFFLCLSQHPHRFHCPSHLTSTPRKLHLLLVTTLDGNADGNNRTEEDRPGMCLATLHFIFSPHYLLSLHLSFPSYSQPAPAHYGPGDAAAKTASASAVHTAGNLGERSGPTHTHQISTNGRGHPELLPRSRHLPRHGEINQSTGAIILASFFWVVPASF